MLKKKSHEEFIEELQEINPNIEAIENYQNAITPITFRCKICGHEWKVPPSNVLRGTGCKKCMIRARTKSREVFLEEVRAINPAVEVLGDYINTNTPIACKCKRCGHEWNPRPSSILKGTGCPKCAGNAKRTHEEFVAEMRRINPDIEILGKYKNTDTTIECRCKVCGCLFSKRPSSLLHGGECPNNKKHWCW